MPNCLVCNKPAKFYAEIRGEKVPLCSQCHDSLQEGKNLSPEEIMDNMQTLMRKADIPLHKQYAVQKTGRMVTESNIDKLSEREREEWAGAIQEYFMTHKAPFLPDIRVSAEEQATT